MKIIKETSLYYFDAWSGGEDTLDTLIDKGLCDNLEPMIEELFPDGCTDTELNDFLWFERDTIADWLGFSDWEDLENDGEEEEEDEEEPDIELLDEYIGNETDFETYCDNADCDGRCPFSKCSNCQAMCEKAYNMMLDGHSFEEAVEAIKEN